MKAPTHVENRIQDAIQDHNFKCRRGELLDLPFDYRYSFGNFSTTHYHSVFLNYSKHCSLVLTLWNNEKDWKMFDYIITTNDDVFSDFVDTIVCQYIKEMYDYYCGYERKNVNTKQNNKTFK